jgi:hypothetical protein
MSKLWLCGITSGGNKANLQAMIDPVAEFFNGLVWTFHYPKDEGADYLEANKGEGEIIYAKWCQRHGYSQTHFLWQGPMQPGDKFVLLDSMERIGKQFCYEKLMGLVNLMDEADIAMVANYGKGFLFRYNEQLRFDGSPHWYPVGLDGRAINMELDKSEFWNVRGEQRDEFQFVDHYMKYWLYPAGSNHALLGLEKNGDPQKLFPEREARRLQFRQVLRELDIPLTVAGVKDYLLTAKPIDGRVKFHVNSEKVINDFYRFYVNGDKSFKDDHDHKNLIKI